MDDKTNVSVRHTNLLDLPQEILLDIFGCSESSFPVHDPSEYHNSWAIDPQGRLKFLGTVRLVCHALDRLISPFLCPVVSVSLSSQSIERLQGLSRNPLIASGIRGIEISLLFRPNAIAEDFQRYGAYASSVLNRYQGECDWHTEFQEYGQDDMCKKAIAWREYREAWTLLANMRRAWRECPESTGTLEHNGLHTDVAGTEAVEDLRTGAEDGSGHLKNARNILRDCFQSYAAAHADQARIVSNGSFIESLVGTLSHSRSPPFIWFSENRLGSIKANDNARSVAANTDALVCKLTEGHDWLTIENTLCKEDDDTGLFFPAGILTGLPIACHDAAVQLKGISINCFPLLRGYRCLLPKPTNISNDMETAVWAAFATACQNIEIFTFGKHGMSCSPIRPFRQSTSDMEIINGFIGAAISGPRLQRLYVCMTPFRVRQGRSGVVDPEHSYPASRIVTAITSTELRSIVLSNIEISEQDLLVLVKSASYQQLTNLYLSGVTLSNGYYASAMGLLHEIVCSRRNTKSSMPDINFNTLQGAEFGQPATFDDDNAWIFGSDEEQDEFWDKLEKHQHPQLLRQVEQWIADGNNKQLNPLLRPRDA